MANPNLTNEECDEIYMEFKLLYQNNYEASSKLERINFHLGNLSPDEVLGEANESIKR